MEKIVEATEKAFLGEFIRLSPKMNELSEILWFVFRMGGSAPSNIITARFPDAKKDMQNFIEMGILRDMDSGNEKIVTFAEKFEIRLISKNISDISVGDIFEALVEGYSKDLGKRYQLDDLMKRLSTVLAAVTVYATPQEPAFLNSVFRAACEQMDGGQISPESLRRTKELLEYFLYKYLGLVQPVGSFAVNLSHKATEIISKSPHLLEVYKNKPKAPAPVLKPHPHQGEE